jgi:RNA recognition motif-containing protein
MITTLTVAVENSSFVMTSVYVANIPFEADAAQLCGVFQGFGPIAEVRIASKRGFSLGFGFVEFKYPEACAECLAHASQIILQDKVLKVEASHAKSAVLDTVFVHTIDQSVSVEDLKNHFAAYNPVDAKIVARYETEKRKGFGFVKCASQADRDRAITDLNLSTLGSRTIFCTAATTAFDKQSRREFTNNRVRLGAVDS